MKLRNIEIWILTAVLIGAAMFFAKQGSKEDATFYFEMATDSGMETIQLWKDDNGDSFVFLPGYGELSQLRIYTWNPVEIGSLCLTGGESCEGLALNQPYELSDGTSITFLRSENLPAMYIDTWSGCMDVVHKKKENKESGLIRVYANDGSLNYQGDLSSIQMRGNSVLTVRKKPYSLKLSKEGDLLGLGQAQKWALLTDDFDPSRLRNKIVLDTAKKLGLPYTADNLWVDLYLNGEYAGVYLLCEPNEVHPERVAIPENGSFLVSEELERRLVRQELPYFRTSLGASLRIRHAGLDNSQLQEIWATAERAIYAENGIDPQTGKHWSECIDLDSWTRKYLIEEVFANVDGGLVSQFFYMDGKDPRIYAGPVWDYDKAMANPCVYTEMANQVYEELVPNIFYVNCRPEIWGSPWYHRLYQTDMFYSYMRECYRNEFLPLLEELVEVNIPDYARFILPAAKMDSIRWAREDPQEQIDILCTYLRQRTDFLNQVWLEEREYKTVVADYFARTTSYIVFPGDTLPKLPTEEGYIWYSRTTKQPVEPSEPIYEDAHIVLIPE